MADREALKYTREHEWVRVEGAQLVVGITEFAAQQLGDVVYVELPEVGATLSANTPFGVVESVKSVSDLFAPVDGTVDAINAELPDSPEWVNEGPLDKGWMLRVTPVNMGDVEGLLSWTEYQAFLEESGA